MPYTPTVTDRTGEFLMRGITGAADSLSDALKERKQKSQKAASLRKTIGVYNPELKDEVQTMGLADLEGYVAGIGMKAAKDKLAQDQSNKDREFNLSKVYADLHQGQLARSNQRDAAGQRFTETLASLATAGGAPSMDFANTLAGEPQPARELGLADIVQAAGQSGLAMEPSSLAQLIRAEQMGQRGGNAGLAFQEDPVTGARLATFGNSILPTGQNPAKQTTNVVALTEPGSGAVVGFGVPGRNGMQVIKPPAKGVSDEAWLKSLNTQLGRAVLPEEREAILNQMRALRNGGGNPSAAAATGGGNSAFETELNDLLKRQR